ncbi:MAG: metallophosphoesterase [Clostridia bacterium]|nr:metallophosphoesterase [Clostridia bacterium]
MRVTEYKIDGGVSDPIVIVQLSDLHSASFGDGNERLYERVKDISPDVICFTGDTVSSSDVDFSVASGLVERLSGLAPVYISLGNHETDLDKDSLERFVIEMESAGGVVLEKEYVDTKINGNAVRIGGTSGYALSVPFWEASYGVSAKDHFNDESFSEQRFMLDFENTDNYKILLLHRPEAATLFWADSGWYDVDLVLSGHTHGGQVRLPFIGGLMAPEEGWFPKYEYGHFVKNGVDVIVSAGLGTGKGIPRFNNIPEIVSVTVE